MSQFNVKRPLLFSATAFLFLYPVCLAEAATTSSFGLQQRTQPTLQTATATQQQNQPKTSQGQLQSALESPSFSQSLESLQSTLNQLKTQLNTLSTQIKDQSKLQVSNALLTSLQTYVDRSKSLQNQYTAQTILLKNAIERYESAQLRTATALEAHQQATTNKEATATALQQAQQNEQLQLTALNEKKDAAQQAAQQLQQAEDSLSQAVTSLTAESTALSAAQASYNLNLSLYQDALTAKEAAQSAYDQALANYNTNLIPDPNWTAPTQEVQVPYEVQYEVQVPHTELVPHTTTTTIPAGLTATTYSRLGYNNAPPLPTNNETPLSTQNVPNIEFNWGGGYVLNSGRAEDVIVKFEGYISPLTSGHYQFYSPADDGTKLYINNQLLIDDWYDKGGGGSISNSVYLEAGSPVPITLYYYENGGGANVWLYSYTASTGYQIVPASWFGSQTVTETTYEEVTTYTTETRTRTEYRTEIQTIKQQGTIQVDIPEGQNRTFTAPAGATFVGASIRYEAYDNPQCGVSFNEVAPAGVTSVTINANNSVFGDPCPGWYKHVVGTLSYYGEPTAPLIPNPALLAEVERTQQNLAAASLTFNEANQNLTAAERTLNQTQDLYDSALSTKTQSASLKESAFTANQLAAQEQQTQQAVYDAAQAELLIKTESDNSSNLALTQATDELEATTFDEEEALANQEETYTRTATTKAQLVSSHEEAVKTSAAASKEISTLEPDPAPTPEPEPEPTPEELPAEVSADNLQEIDLTKIDPTTITEEQVEQLKEAAYETFETAEQGSAEYEQALDALYLAAEADDIVVPEELAALPAIGPALAGAVELVNFLGNAGADMSPKVREESKKVVVTAVVAAGAAIQSAAAAATMSSASTRKIGN